MVVVYGTACIPGGTGGGGGAAVGGTMLLLEHVTYTSLGDNVARPYRCMAVAGC